jgi:site-specific recombinase XerD
MTLTEAMAMLGRQMEAEGSSPITVAAYQTDVRAFVGYLNSVRAKDTVGHFTREHVQGWLVEQTEKGIHPNTRNRRLAALARLARFLISIEKIERDPTSVIKRAKKPQRVTRYLKAEIATRLIRAAGPTMLSQFGPDRLPHQTLIYHHRNEAVLRAMVQGGLRISEVEGLTLMRLRPNGFVVLGKGDKERHVTMPAAAMQVLETWLAERRGGLGPEDAVFTNHEGGRLSRKQIYRVVKDAAHTLALEGVHPHLLRHSMASLMRERGVELDVIRDRLGHVSIATTERYVHAVPIGQAEAAEKLGDL